MNIERYNQSCKWTKEMADTYISENKDNGNDSDYTFAEWCYLRGAKDEHEKCMNETKMFIEKHSVEIGKKQGIRKFAEWLQKESIFYLDYCDWKKCVRVVDEELPNYKISHTESRNATLDEVLAEYEKEQAKGGEND